MKLLLAFFVGFGWLFAWCLCVVAKRADADMERYATTDVTPPARERSA